MPRVYDVDFEAGVVDGVHSTLELWGATTEEIRESYRIANQQHLDIFKQGVDAWNQWRVEHAKMLLNPIGVDLKYELISDIDLSDADLSRIQLVEVNLSGVNLRGANLSEANLSMATLKNAILNHADLSFANLEEAVLRFADLSGADLSNANLFEVDLSSANLSRANLNAAFLKEANLSGAILTDACLEGAEVGFTVFGDLDLHTVKGLETLKHIAHSSISIDTIYRSQGVIPEAFLKGAGVDDIFITYIRSLVGKPIDYYSCFISYSSGDEAFARRLYADLQSHNVRCWFAPEDLKIGEKLRHRIDESIHIYDKLLLVLSEYSIASNWVAYEVEKALDKEPEGKPNVLFPIRLDKAILTCETDWAKEIRKTRHIGDFEHWKDHDTYQVAFERLLRDLKAQSK